MKKAKQSKKKAKSSKRANSPARVEDEVEGGFDVGGGERAAILETDAGMEMEDVGERVGNFPCVGEISVKVHLGVALQQAAEEEAVDTLGVGIGGVAGVEVGGIGFD